MKNNVPDRIIKDIAVFSKEYDIQKVILFGSRAKGVHTDRSDIDLAVSGGDFDSFYWAVKERMHSLLSFDIIDFDKNTSEHLKKEIERDGVVIYERAR